MARQKVIRRLTCFWRTLRPLTWIDSYDASKGVRGNQSFKGIATHFAKRIKAGCQHTHEDDTGASECAVWCWQLIKESSSKNEGEDLEGKSEEVVL
jgi:hypothetical protein